jgi:Protein of unknown function (DUF2384)
MAEAARVIERVAAETELEPEQVERVLEATLGAAVDSGGSDAAELAEVVLSAASAWRAQGRQLTELIEALRPQHREFPAPAALLQARRNAEARDALLGEFGGLRSAEVAELAGSRAANRAALANRWRAEGRLVAVPVGDELVYPGFQFGADGRPHPTVGAALAELRRQPGLSDWQAALWFASPTGWLGGRRPVDLLDTEPDAVAEAARREASEIAG